MPTRNNISSFFEKFSLRFSIFERLVIGNSAIIVLGAVGGTLLTRHLTDQAADIWLILFFAATGTLISIIINYWIIKTALRPFYDLQALINKNSLSSKEIETRTISFPDSDVYHLVNALNTLIKQLREQNLQLKAISEQAINAQEDERKRIAQSLHDDTGQALSSLVISLDRIEDDYENVSTDELFSQIDSARSLTKSALAELRKIIYGLRPTLLDDLGLVPAIRWYARSELEEADIHLSLYSPLEDERLSPQLTLTLFRISQEAINNIKKHSQAKNVSISITQKNSEIVLKIEDDGVGFDNQNISQSAFIQQHWGLIGIRERVELIRGKIEVETSPGKGTILVIQAPISLE